MKQNTSLKIILLFFGSTLTIVLTMLAFIPFLKEALAVEVIQPEAAAAAPVLLPEAPEEVLVTAVYEMEENSKKISAIYIEVFLEGSNTVTYFEVPADTKVNLSEALYKSLQTYAPELPQYLKISNMAESFSAEYGLVGSNRILSEVLGITISEYIRADKESLSAWLEVLAQEKTDMSFFKSYTMWLENSVSSLMLEERWMYYESFRKIKSVVTEVAPGSQEKDGYLLSGKRSKERLQELMLRVESEE